MWNIQNKNHAKIEIKLEVNVKKSYAMIFKEFCPYQLKTIFE